MKRAGRLANVLVGGSMALMTLGAGAVALAPAATAAQSMTATTWVNLRSGPSTGNPVLTALGPNEAVSASGTVRGGWYQVTTSKGVSGWVYQDYLRASGPAPAPASPAASGSATTTTAVNVRSGPGLGHSVVAVAAGGTPLATTGRTSGGWTEVIHAGQARWISTNYLRTGSAAPAPSAPAATNVSLPGYDRLNANAKAAAQHVMNTYPQIRTIGGWRASSNYSSDHPNGRAIDVMIPNWSQQSGIDLGWQIARDFQANAARHNVTYIIWRQQVWNASYPDRGWRAMEDRGSATANHYDHVHVSVRA